MSTNGSFPDRGPSVLAVTTATLIVASLFVLARLVCRVAIVKHMSADDYFIVLAWVGPSNSEQDMSGEELGLPTDDW
jgi:hypothetical protein